MKKALVLLALLSMFVFVGCGSSQDEAAQTTAETTVAETTAAPETAVTTTGTDAATNDIGVDKAKEIALQDAGISADNATFTQEGSDIDNGVSIFEIEFTSGDMEYSYDIDAATGNILEKSKESIYD